MLFRSPFEGRLPEVWWISGRFVILGGPVKKTVGGYGVSDFIAGITAGPTGQEQAAEQSQITASQELAAIGQQSLTQEQQQYAQSQTLEAPLIAKETALASGDRSAALSASMPVISQISQGYQASKAGTMNNLPPGAARDKALAQLETQQYTGIATAQASEVEAAPGILAQLGAGSAGLSVQELAGALSGNTSSAQVSGQVASEENAAKANSLQFFGSLAGAAGGAIGGFNLGGGGSSGVTGAEPAAGAASAQTGLDQMIPSIGGW